MHLAINNVHLYTLASSPRTWQWTRGGGHIVLCGWLLRPGIYMGGAMRGFKDSIPCTRMCQPLQDILLDIYR